jgi:hypothetical protein
MLLPFIIDCALSILWKRYRNHCGLRFEGGYGMPVPGRQRGRHGRRAGSSAQDLGNLRSCARPATLRASATAKMREVPRDARCIADHGMRPESKARDPRVYRYTDGMQSISILRFDNDNTCFGFTETRPERTCRLSSPPFGTPAHYKTLPINADITRGGVSDVILTAIKSNGYYVVQADPQNVARPRFGGR